MKKELKQEILEIIKNNNYERYSVFQDPETKELVLQCFFTDYYDDTIGEAVSFENYNEYTFEYDKELEDYLEDILFLKTPKYYLYDIQNDEKVLESNHKVYSVLEDCIFNEDMLFTLYERYDGPYGFEIDDLYFQLRNLNLSNERIYKIIEIEVD